MPEILDPYSDGNKQLPRVVGQSVQQKRTLLEFTCPKCGKTNQTADKQALMLWDKAECPCQCAGCGGKFFVVKQRLLTCVGVDLPDGFVIDKGHEAVKRAQKDDQKNAARAKKPGKVNGP